jgi:hypothetical protein
VVARLMIYGPLRQSFFRLCPAKVGNAESITPVNILSQRWRLSEAVMFGESDIAREVEKTDVLACPKRKKYTSRSALQSK